MPNPLKINAIVEKQVQRNMNKVRFSKCPSFTATALITIQHTHFLSKIVSTPDAPTDRPLSFKHQAT